MYDITPAVLSKLPQNCSIWPTASDRRCETLAVMFDDFQINVAINTFGDVSIRNMPDYFPLSATSTDSMDAVLSKIIQGIPQYRAYVAEVKHVQQYSSQKRNWVSDAIYKANASERDPLDVIDGNVKHMITKAEDIEPWHVSVLRKLGFIKTHYIARFVQTPAGFILDGLTGYPSLEERDTVFDLIHSINMFRLKNKRPEVSKEKLAAA